MKNLFKNHLSKRDLVNGIIYILKAMIVRSLLGIKFGLWDIKKLKNKKVTSLSLFALRIQIYVEFCLRVN